MTKQGMARQYARMAERLDSDAADFAADQAIGAAKEEAGINRLRDDLYNRSLVDRLRALMTPTNKGYITLCWDNGLAGCSMANGVAIGATADAKSIPAALDQALLDMTEMGF